MATITYADVQAVLIKMREDGCRAQTQRNVFNVLRGVLNEARDRGALTHNPADRLARKLPSSQRHEGRRAQVTRRQQHGLSGAVDMRQ